MKLIPALLCVCTLSLSAWAEMQPLRKGDDASRIIEILGEPNGFMESELQGIYYYDRGEVRTRHGKVTIIHLLSEKELAQKQAVLEEERERRLQEGKARFAEIMEQGFPEEYSGREQVAFWEAFNKRYPGVNIHIPYLQAQKLADIERAEEAESRRLAQLERRVLEAELRAARAQEQAARAEQSAITNQRSNRFRFGSCYLYPGTTTVRYTGSGSNPYVRWPGHIRSPVGIQRDPIQITYQAR